MKFVNIEDSLDQNLWSLDGSTVYIYVPVKIVPETLKRVDWYINIIKTNQYINNM